MIFCQGITMQIARLGIQCKIMRLAGLKHGFTDVTQSVATSRTSGHETSASTLVWKQETYLKK